MLHVSVDVQDACSHSKCAVVIRYERHWRYHKEQKIWITRAPGVEPSQKTNTYERGTYIYFDHMQWKKVCNGTRAFSSRTALRQGH